jgi:hypothetical protein
MLKVVCPEHKNEGKGVKVRERERQEQIAITAPTVSHQCAPGGLFIGVVTGSYYNIRNAPVHLP